MNLTSTINAEPRPNNAMQLPPESGAPGLADLVLVKLRSSDLYWIKAKKEDDRIK